MLVADAVLTPKLSARTDPLGGRPLVEESSFWRCELDMLFPVLFVALLVSVLVWLFLCQRLFAALESRHSGKYESMSSPDLSTNSTFSGSFALLEFLFRQEWLALEDPALDTLCKRMRVVFVICSLIILSIALSIVLGLVP